MICTAAAELCMGFVQPLLANNSSPSDTCGETQALPCSISRGLDPAPQPWGHSLCWGVGVALATSRIGQHPVQHQAGASPAAGLKVLGWNVSFFNDIIES